MNTNESFKCLLQARCSGYVNRDHNGNDISYLNYLKLRRRECTAKGLFFDVEREEKAYSTVMDKFIISEVGGCFKLSTKSNLFLSDIIDFATTLFSVDDLLLHASGDTIQFYLSK